jgi:hypothetical protein
VTIYASWPIRNDFSHDLAIVHLNASVGARVGWLGVAGSDEFGPTQLSTAGYPSDKALNDTDGNEVLGMWATSCKVRDTNATDRVTQVTCDVIPGQSGSPMWATGEAASSAGVPTPASISAGTGRTTTTGRQAGSFAAAFVKGVVSYTQWECPACANDTSSCCGPKVSSNFAAQLTRSAARDVLSWAATKVEAPRIT